MSGTEPYYKESIDSVPPPRACMYLTFRGVSSAILVQPVTVTDCEA